MLSVAGKVVDAVKAGAIRHFFLIGGCDGARPGRNYYTEFAQAVPERLPHPHPGLRKVPLQQAGLRRRSAACRACSTSASATTPTRPCRLRARWPMPSSAASTTCRSRWCSRGTSRRRCAILLTLLHLGVRNIRIGPTLPAFITPAVLGVLQEKFNLMAITEPEKDLAAILN